MVISALMNGKNVLKERNILSLFPNTGHFLNRHGRGVFINPIDVLLWFSDILTCQPTIAKMIPTIFIKLKYHLFQGNSETGMLITYIFWHRWRGGNQNELGLFGAISNGDTNFVPKP